MLIWPDSQNAQVVTSLGGLDGAINALELSESPAPTKNELNLIDVAATAGTARVGRIIADTAIRWRDPQIWLKAVTCCRAGSNVMVLELHRFVDAYETFPWATVAPV